MSDTINQKGVLIPCKTTKYDELEDTLLLQTTQEAAFEVLSDWLNKEMHISFAVFTNSLGQKKYTKIYAPVQDTEKRIKDIVSGRFSQYIPEKCLCKHPTGDISVPYIYNKNKTGAMFLGVQEGKEFSKEQIDSLFLIMGVLNKVMLFFEAIKVNNDKNILKDAFSKIVSPSIADKILQDPNAKEDSSSGERGELSVMVSRIEDFGAISQNIEPQALIKILNLYICEMSKVILDLGGVIGRYEGDTLVAFFGMQKKKDHATRCCLAALRMKKLEDMLNKQMKDEGLVVQPLHIAIGINTGLVLMINMGSEENPDYTVLGSNVTIASRIEGLNKFFKTSILISSKTYETVCASFEAKPAGKAHLKELDCCVELFSICSGIQGQLEQYGGEAISVAESEEMEEM